VSTFDVFDLVIGAIWGDVHRRFEIGGDEDSFRTDRAGPTKAQRFPPVALFSAPQEVGRDGTARVRFTMPHYLGSVRVMAVAAAGASYGSAEATTPVRDPIVILPSLPRVAGPSETFAMPVTVFALEEGLGPITLSVSTEGPLGIEGEAATTLDIDDIGDDDRRFRIRALNRSGVARVTVRATSERFETETTTELEVRPVNPFRYGGTEVAIDPRGTATIPIPALGIEGHPPGLAAAHLGSGTAVRQPASVPDPLSLRLHGADHVRGLSSAEDEAHPHQSDARRSAHPA
jgi:uncharacterized protein YfaS (alpha-2-macroglobulin family)